MRLSTTVLKYIQTAAGTEYTVESVDENMSNERMGHHQPLFLS